MSPDAEGGGREVRGRRRVVASNENEVSKFPPHFILTASFSPASEIWSLIAFPARRKYYVRGIRYEEHQYFLFIELRPSVREIQRTARGESQQGPRETSCDAYHVLRENART